MTRLTPHFNREEFACKCKCGKDTVDVELMRVLSILRVHYDKPITITSGFRCPKHNKAVGGARNSRHMDGKAADIKVKGVSPKKVFKYLEKLYPDKYGVGLYSKWVHIDVRNGLARWRK